MVTIVTCLINNQLLWFIVLVLPYHISDAIDFDLLISTLRKLKEGKSVKVPIYDFNTHARAKYTVGVAFSGVLCVVRIM